MIPTARIYTKADFGKIKAAADRAAFKSFGNAAASISKDAKASIEKAAGPSHPGSPPHTHKGNILRRAIRYAADKTGAVIGPAASIAGDVGEGMEFGGEFRGQRYDARPFMEPALVRGAPRFAQEWSGSIGE